MYVFALKMISISILLVILPLISVMLIGLEPGNFLVLPHVTNPVQNAPFSWLAWSAMAIFITAIVILYFYTLNSCSIHQEYKIEHKARNLPWWGYTGIIITIIFWILAWNRFSWFAEFQVYTFTPIWLGYILTMNALTYRQQGNCLITRQPHYLCTLFLLSAIFWWYYEYINIYIRNWFYVGTDELSSLEIIIHSSIAYATVLPAVLSTTEWLNGFPIFNTSLQHRWKPGVNRPLTLAIISTTGGACVIMLAVINPQYFFPIVWLAPVFLVTGIQYILERSTVFSLLTHGDWRPVSLPPLAALFCGFFWELWNFRSYAHWEYNIPYVDAFHLFEMPLLGYAGYLPFGITCLAVAELLPGSHQLFIKKQ